MLVVGGPWGLPLEVRPDMGSAGGIGVGRRVGQKQTAASMRPMMRPGMGVPRVVSVVGCGMSVVGCRLSVVAGRLAVDRCELSTECNAVVPLALWALEMESRPTSGFPSPPHPSPAVPRLGSARLQTEFSHWKSDQ